MCGIAGILDVNSKQIDKNSLVKMTQALSHRGPDDEGYYLDNYIGLGHRRLSIIELSKLGHQPMTTDDGRLTISYNGELYNYKELRTELAKKGHNFKSNSDTEVLIYAWKEWGARCLTKLNGMFAFAIWDNTEKKLYMARDRYGIKPLYYSLLGGTLSFASEQKAIKLMPGYKDNFDVETLVEYLTFQNIFTDNTFSKDIKLLPAGNFATISLGKANIELTQYWDFHYFCEDKSPDHNEYMEELDFLLNQSLKRQLISDVELGSYLSGGMDSGTLTALASYQLPSIKTFTCGFDLSSASGLELTFDERTKAEAMSALFKTEHYEVVLKAGDMERCFDQLSYHLEEPRVGQSYPNFYASKLASRFVKVVLSGAGGDELFGGYPWRYYSPLDGSSFEENTYEYYKYWNRLLSDDEKAEVFKPIKDVYKNHDTLEIFKSIMNRHGNKIKDKEEFVNHCLYFESKTFLHGLLVVEDKLSMAHSLETRVPFLDNDLVDFAMKCPIEFKLKNLRNYNKEDRFKKTNDGKQILRKVMSKYIPNDITEGIKQGFSAPDASWFKGDSIDYVQDRLVNNNAKIYDYLDSKSINKLLNQHMSGEQNKRLLIWSLLSLENMMSS